jgi:hypothetical protein
VKAARRYNKRITFHQLHRSLGNIDAGMKVDALLSPSKTADGAASRSLANDHYRGAGPNGRRFALFMQCGQASACGETT